MWWLILLIPLALIVFLLFLKVRLCLVYDEDFNVKAKVLFLNIPLFPRPNKPPRPKDYSLKALEKKQKKLNKKNKKKEDKEKAKPKNEEAPPKDKGTKLKEILELIKIILDNVMSPFGRYLKVEILALHIKIGNSDPAKTAVLYGGVCQTVSYIVELLSNVTNVDVKKRNSISVTPDFFEGKTEAKINITLGLRVWHALSLAIKFFMGYLKNLNSKKANQTSAK